MTAPTIDLEVEQPARTLPPCMVDDDWETPCPMTGRNSCPTDQATIDKCTQC